MDAHLNNIFRAIEQIFEILSLKMGIRKKITFALLL